MFDLQLLDSASKDFERLPRHVQIRFSRAFEALAIDPKRPRAGLDIVPMRANHTWRLRVGRYRAIYEIQGNRIVLTAFSHRSTAYR